MGSKVDSAGIKPEPNCVQPILDYFRPTVVNLRCLLGMINIFCCSKKKTLLEWTDDAISAFDEFKNALTNATLLYHPNGNASIILFTDASDTTLKGALYQIMIGELEPPAFFSCKLSKSEAKWSTYDRVACNFGVD